MEEKKKPKVKAWDDLGIEELQERVARLEAQMQNLEAIVQTDLDFNTPLKLETDQ